MGRIGRIYYNNAVYHITIRGNNKQAVLRSDEDKERFLATLSKYKKRFEFKLYGFVIMDNHVHLVIGVSNRNNISKIMQAITLSYSQKFRSRYDYTGYVWQGRFNSNVIESDTYITACLDYIHNNPVRAEMVGKVADYIWSSYHFYNDSLNPIKDFICIDQPSFDGDTSNVNY